MHEHAHNVLRRTSAHLGLASSRRAKPQPMLSFELYSHVRFQHTFVTDHQHRSVTWASQELDTRSR